MIFFAIPQGLIFTLEKLRYFLQNHRSNFYSWEIGIFFCNTTRSNIYSGDIWINFLQCRRLRGFRSVVFQESNLFGKFIWKKTRAVVLYFRWETLLTNSVFFEISFWNNWWFCHEFCFWTFPLKYFPDFCWKVSTGVWVWVQGEHFIFAIVWKKKFSFVEGIKSKENKGIEKEMN